MRATSRAAQSDARSGSRPQPPPRPPAYGSRTKPPATSSRGLLQRLVLHLANTVELAQACRPTSRAPAAAAVVMGRRGPGQWAGCEEAAVARDLLPEDGRKWLRCLAGGGRGARGEGRATGGRGGGAYWRLGPGPGLDLELGGSRLPAGIGWAGSRFPEKASWDMSMLKPGSSPEPQQNTSGPVADFSCLSEMA
ncbi:hypothetical protein LEMLEM_LOCUS26318 [Lemmus lemmus]